MRKYIILKGTLIERHTTRYIGYPNSFWEKFVTTKNVTYRDTDLYQHQHGCLYFYVDDPDYDIIEVPKDSVIIVNTND